MQPEAVTVTQEDADAAVAAQFGREFRAEQERNYGCAGDIECTFKFDGNCVCFNTALARLRHQPAPSEAVAQTVATTPDGLRWFYSGSYWYCVSPEEPGYPSPTNREKVLEEALRKREDMTIGPISADLHGVMVRFTDPGAAGKFFKALQALRSTPEGEEG